jgi:hypothetical protein
MSTLLKLRIWRSPLALAWRAVRLPLVLVMIGFPLLGLLKRERGYQLERAVLAAGRGAAILSGSR